MGDAYSNLVEDRDVLLTQMHAPAASADPAVAETMRDCFARLVDLVEREPTGPDEVRAFFAHGMLINVLAAMHAADVDEPWSQSCSSLPRRR